MHLRQYMTLYILHDIVGLDHSSRAPRSSSRNLDKTAFSRVGMESTPTSDSTASDVAALERAVLEAHVKADAQAVEIRNLEAALAQIAETKT